jgi:hypothetical protein
LFRLKSGDTEIDIKSAASDFTQQVADLNLKVANLSTRVEEQQHVNTSFNDTLESLNRESKANVSIPKIPSIAVDVTSKNSNFTLFVVYRDQRTEDARKLVESLLKAGFKAASISSDLSEIPNNVQKRDTTEVVLASKSQLVATEIVGVVKSALGLSSVPTEEVASLGKPDAQILLF